MQWVIVRMREPMLLPAEERGETLPHVLRNQSEQNPMRQRMKGRSSVAQMEMDITRKTSFFSTS